MNLLDPSSTGEAEKNPESCKAVEESAVIQPEAVRLTQERVEKRITRLISERRIGFSDLPETIYHYTSAAGLHGMLTTNSVWLTHARSLNDSSEYLYGINLIAGVVARKTGNMANEFRSAIYEWASSQREAIHSRSPQMASSSTVDAYFFCLCRSRDQLGQWRAYTPDAGGYAIGFSTGDFKRLLDESQTSMEPVIYDAPTQERIIEIYIEEYYNSISTEGDPKLRSELFFTLQSGLTYEAYKFKHAGFSQEDEIRIMYHKGSEDCRVRVSQNYIVPYIERAMPDNEKLPIREIIVGPTSDPSRSIHGLVQLLKHHKYAQVGIYTSEIPLRN
ncbi:DUF2971 domain-containing protein [Deinococcus xianganensis]|uniref:DUF2971 domain-containing protein n=1 Tax=Deinococcus xianganensis TaxID=1507289 RepID=A0A6I4YFK5_9DEIO|nr:DUF2971 domain-containing protein [Deinococcus xianganensis]MXV20332.1 DUF2971 domain-containing protein [Deinococcus xianganensis]